MLLAIVCIAGSCTDEDEYTRGQWMKKASYNGVYRAYASGFTIGNYGYLCGASTERTRITRTTFGSMT